MSKNRGQSRNRSLRRGVVNELGQSLKRPFNNRKRTLGRAEQERAEKYYKYLKAKLAKAKKLYEEELINEQIKKLDEGISKD